MKATLEYDLNDPDDEQAHLRATQSLSLALAIWDIEQYLRAQVKYNEQLTADGHDALDKAREEFYSILNKHDINMDKILS